MLSVSTASHLFSILYAPKQPTEHMEEDEQEGKTLPEWVELEYLVRQFPMDLSIRVSNKQEKT